jgi:hypothetical protein
VSTKEKGREQEGGGKGAGRRKEGSRQEEGRE